METTQKCTLDCRSTEDCMEAGYPCRKEPEMTEQNKQPPAEAGEGVLIAPMIWLSKSSVGWAKSGAANGYGQFSFVNRDEYEIPMTLFAPVKKYADAADTSQTTATQAALAAAKLECAEMCREDESGRDSGGFYSDLIVNSIPAEATAALRELIGEGVRSGLQAARNSEFMTGKLPRVAEFDATRDIDRILAEKGLK